MSRQVKQGFSYLRFDVNSFEEGSIELLMLDQGAEAFTVWMILKARIYSTGIAYKLTADFYGTLQKKYAVHGNAQEYVAKMLSLGLFDQDVFDRTGYLTSESIQHDIFEMAQTCRRTQICFEQEFLLVDPECYSLRRSNTEKKVKESKGNPYITNIHRNLREIPVIKNEENELENPAEIDQSQISEYAEFDDVAAEVERYIASLGNGTSEDEKNELRANVAALHEIDSEELACDNRWMIQHKRPMVKYPHIWLTIQQLHQIWKAYIEAGLKPGVDFPKTFLSVESKISSKQHFEQQRIDAYSWLIGWALREATDQLTSTQRLMNSKEAASRYGVGVS